MDMTTTSPQEPSALSAQDEFYRGILTEKYAKGAEQSAADVYERVAAGLAKAEDPADAKAWQKQFRQAFDDGFVCAGRIMSACGTDIGATLINCFVEPVGDSTYEPDASGKPGIFKALAEAAETQRRGGGVGYDFSALRPKGAKVHGTASRSSGPLSYMRVFDRMCETVESAGARRGAQMGILRCDHPDIEAFVVAKDIRAHARKLRAAGIPKGELFATLQHFRSLSNFNISVGVTDPFMEAVMNDTEFELVHVAEPDPREHPNAYRRNDGKWVYRKIRAVELWDTILRTTYETADPGVVFIDNMNADNNLFYCERIDACNPCGEQPLPPYGCCCLGSINLARLVRQPFYDASFDFDTLGSLAAIGVRMLDNVLDVTHWPLEQQRQEAANKRRVGLGFLGLGSATMMMGLKYGSPEAVEFARKVAETMRNAAYRASVDLAAERGAFPLFDVKQYLASPFTQRLPADIRCSIAQHGIRNSHLLSIAPTGTITPAFCDNVSAGIEPVYAWRFNRTRKMMDGTLQSFDIEDGGYRQYRELGHDVEHLPASFVNAQTLTPDEHLAIQAAVQPYIDSAISKTINIPEAYAFSDFKDIYTKAWKANLKGCTTFRPNDSTGSVLTVNEDKPKKGKDTKTGNTSNPAHHNAAPVVRGTEQSDPDRRIRLDTVPEPVLNSLKWPGRPTLPGGNPAWTYMVGDGESRFAVFIGHVENGEKTPFEVWVNGAEQPRGLGATAKLLSMDMRSRDRAWLQTKLRALAKTRGTRAVTIRDAHGNPVTYASPTAAMVALVEQRCRELGSFDTEGRAHPVLDALMSPKEPKTSGD
ncbi:MAG: adenosylcobalamin-dependent ribonucleoside-diphosphate reductase, partial [Sinobacteraceae bacterium]|nr:adenosylcobalamin-dependent ribonucleoside-diphosphate reductase [Nevskiaceae bacterium]